MRLAWPAGAASPQDRPLVAVAARGAAAFRAPPVGTVYGTLLNHRDALAALGDAVHAAPYKAPPKAPVLYIKPRNTLAGHGVPVVVPADADRTGGRRHAGHRHRPHGLPRAARPRRWPSWPATPSSTTQRAARVASTGRRCASRPRRLPARSARRSSPRALVPDPDALDIARRIDGETGAAAPAPPACMRPVAQLIADVTEFMTLCRRRRADARRGGRRAARTRRPDGAHRDRRHGRAREPAGARERGGMKHARVAYGGAIHDGHRPHGGGCGWPTAACWPRTQVVWLPPLRGRARHRAGPELRRPREGAGQGADASRAKDEPLVFLKSPAR